MMNRTIRCSLLAVAIAIGAGAEARAGVSDGTTPIEIPIAMGYYGVDDQTQVFRGYFLPPGPGEILGVTLQDRNAQGSASGAFSGFDLDFFYVNKTGDLSDGSVTTIDTMTLTPGSIRTATTPRFEPTAWHPGPLFGTLVRNDNALIVDQPTATLESLDGRYIYGEQLSVDTSSGWVSLGDGGKIGLTIDPVSINNTFDPYYNVNGIDGAYLFIGDVGRKDEFADAVVTVLFQPDVDYSKVADAGGPYTLSTRQTAVRLDASKSDLPESELGWKYVWCIDGPQGLVLPATDSDTLVLPANTARLLGDGPHEVILLVAEGELGYATGKYYLDNAPLWIDTRNTAPSWGDPSAADLGDGGEGYTVHTGGYLELDASGSDPRSTGFVWRVLDLHGNVLDVWVEDTPYHFSDYYDLQYTLGSGAFTLELTVYDTAYNVLGRNTTELIINPEPATLALLGAGGTLLLRSRRRR